MSTPIAVDADAEMLEACRVSLPEVDRVVGGTPAAGGPSRVGTIWQRGGIVASMFGVDRPVDATPVENIRAAQAAADELDKLEGDERRHMTERV